MAQSTVTRTSFPYLHSFDRALALALALTLDQTVLPGRGTASPAFKFDIFDIQMSHATHLDESYQTYR